MKIWPDMIQRSEEWFRARAGRPTASQFDRVITATGKDSSQWHDFALELCAQSIRPDEIDFAGNRHTDRGTELEPEARQTFTAIMGLDVREVGFVTRDDEIIGCSPDAIIYQGETPVGGLELKCPLAKNHAKYLVGGDLPADYKQQVHGSMAVTGLRSWYFMSYCPGLTPFIVRVDWDDYTDKVADALDRFLVYYSEARKTVIPLLLGKEAA